MNIINCPITYCNGDFLTKLSALVSLAFYSTQEHSKSADHLWVRQLHSPIWNNIIKERLTESATGTTSGGGAQSEESVSVPGHL